MRRTPFLVAPALLGAAFAQTFNAPEQKVQDAFNQLRGVPAIFTQVIGTETIGTRVTDFRVDSYWIWNPLSIGPNATAKVKVFSYMNGRETARTVGDGTTLWTYDPVRNEYSASVYGVYNGSLPADYRAHLFQVLTNGSRGSASHSVRLLREVFAGDIALYRSWMPNVAAVGALDGSVTYTGRNRSVRFSFDKHTNALTAIDFVEDSQSAGQPREVRWTMTVYSTGFNPATWNFQFVPPIGARAIAGTKPVTIG